MKYLQLSITDTMGFIDNESGDYLYNQANGTTSTGWYRLPDGWLREGRLLPERQEALLRHLLWPELARGERGRLDVHPAKD